MSLSRAKVVRILKTAHLSVAQAYKLRYLENGKRLKKKAVILLFFV